MKLLHHNSSHCMSDNLNLFEVPPTQTAIESCRIVTVSPISTVTSTGPVEWLIQGSSEEYVDVSETFMEIKAKCVNDQGNLATSTDAIAPANATLAAMFSQCMVSLNDIPITHASSTYAYKAIIDMHMNYDWEAKRSVLQTAQYYKDDNISNPDPKSTTKPNKGLVKRHKLCCAEKEFTLVGRIHSDVFDISKYIPNGVDIKIKMIRSRSNFAMMGGGSIHITGAKLHVRKVFLTPSLLMANERLAMKESMKFFYTRTEIKVLHVDAKKRGHTQDNIFIGALPQRVVLCMVDSDAFNGDYTKNPFEFNHFKVTSMCLCVDGRNIPATPLQGNFSTGDYARFYYTMYTETIGLKSRSGGGGITMDEYLNGHAFFCFDLTPDLSSSCGNHLNVAKTGNMGVDITFEEALSSHMNILMYSEFEGLFEMNHERRVISEVSS